MRFIYNDGGRAEYFKADKVGDCGVRAICNATELDYLLVYKSIAKLSKGERTGKRKRGVSSPRNGVYKETLRKLMEMIGWEFVPTMTIGSGCKVHLASEELPSKGSYVVCVSKHYTCVKDGTLYDTYDCSRGGDRCVYGYYKPTLGYDAKLAEKTLTAFLDGSKPVQKTDKTPAREDLKKKLASKRRQLTLLKKKEAKIKAEIRKLEKEVA